MILEWLIWTSRKSTGTAWYSLIDMLKNLRYLQTTKRPWFAILCQTLCTRVQARTQMPLPASRSNRIPAFPARAMSRNIAEVHLLCCESFRQAMLICCWDAHRARLNHKSELLPCVCTEAWWQGARWIPRTTPLSKVPVHAQNGRTLWM